MSIIHDAAFLALTSIYHAATFDASDQRVNFVSTELLNINNQAGQRAYIFREFGGFAHHGRESKKIAMHLIFTGLNQPVESLFSYLTGNNDMHLNNFSVIHRCDHSISLSPAYDLVNLNLVFPDDVDELPLTLNGRKGKSPKQTLILSQRDLICQKGLFLIFTRGLQARVRK